MDAAIGGVMLQSLDWQGGFRDQGIACDESAAGNGVALLQASIDTLKAKIFPIHGL